MGSNVIAEASRQRPGRLAGLLLVDQYKSLEAGLTNEAVEAFAARLRTNFRDSVAAFVRRMFVSTSDSILIERVATDMSSAPPVIALDALVYTLNYSRQMPQTLKELKLPVIAINDNRRPTDLASMERYGVQVMIMPGVGHFLMMENPGILTSFSYLLLARWFNKANYLLCCLCWYRSLRIIQKKGNCINNTNT